MEIKILKNKNFIYKVKAGESLTDVSNKFNILENQIISDNNLSSRNLLEGDLLFISNQNTQTYIVKPLDNLEKIAKKLNVTTSEIISKNSLKTNNLFIGQKLVI